MAYVTAMSIALFLMLCDIFFTSIRSTLQTGGDVATYVTLSIHEVCAIAQAVTIFAFFSYTVWFTAGLLGHLTFTVRVTLPLLLLRLFFIQMPVIYGKFISSEARRWSDPAYGVLFCLDIASCLSMCTSMMYTVACLSEKRLYAPYHTDWRPDAHDAQQSVVPQQSVVLSGRGFAPHP
jgi:hypothetical protein